MPTTPSEQDPRPAPGHGTRLVGTARTRAGVGVLVVATLAGAVAIAGLLGGASSPGGDVAAASTPVASSIGSPSPETASVPSPVTSASLPPSTAPTASVRPPTVAPSRSPVPTPSATSTPSPAASPTAAPADAVPADALQARLDRIRARMRIPGVSVAILWDDGRRWLGASGLRDVKAGDPMTTGTAFALASVSKTMTAAVVLQLVEEGSLSLDQRVAPLLPGYDLHPKITVRQLLDHTSGLPDYFLNVRIDRPLQARKNATWTAEQTWAYVPDKRPRPGKRWMYSNSNYLLLGELVKAVTGRSLAEEVRARLLDPLGLETTWYQAEEEPRVNGTRAYRLVAAADGTVRPVPVAGRSDVMPFRSVVTAAAGAGSIAATAADAARWIQAFGGGEVLTDAMQAEMLADVARTAALLPRLPYGLGIQAVPIADRYALGHSGRFLGFRNVVRYLPGEGVSIAVLTNQGARDPARIAEALLRIVLEPEPASPSASAPPSATPTATPAP